MTGDRRREAARRRRTEQDGLSQFFAEQRKRHRDALDTAEDRIRRRQALAREAVLTSAYTVEQRGYTFGGTPTKEQFQIQED